MMVSYSHVLNIACSQSPSLDLSPSEDEEWVALQEQLAEETKEQRELEERRKEIREKIVKQSDEITRVKRGNAVLQTKVNMIHTQFTYVSSS